MTAGDDRRLTRISGALSWNDIIYVTECTENSSGQGFGCLQRSNSNSSVVKNSKFRSTLPLFD
ncbi:hypothetical protein SISSUDRAFT_1051145 [Sistotremastrum suecicum HHB10207 ss-3]|uniref:Uncharacterized protein n=1 Tax=Sistotremastrum suecicum HHB10207 ss-3 TaxID=1314776 RepID=A0A166ASY2_9AGAM|nr:hypothetical protein SISSUDRAFT_1051145 [Sistotremastrum suecicum HHB10207 ss-3]